jgi:hypothetical protein
VATNRSLLLANEDSATGPLTPHPRRGTGSVACCPLHPRAARRGWAVARQVSFPHRSWLARATRHISGHCYPGPQ